ncbi:MAG: hypothetical protein NVS2B3_12890 [Vulcanimicrobiaceae bacterium]
MNTSAINDWSAGFLTGLTAGLARFFGAIPNIIGALLLLVIGWVIAGLLGAIIVKVARAIHIDTVADRVGANAFLARSGAKLKTSDVLGEVVKWVVRLIFVEMAAEQLGMPQVSQIINNVLAFVPNIIVAAVILGVGAFLGQILGGVVRAGASEAGLASANTLAKLTSGAVMAFAIIAALNELNVAPVVVNTLYIGLVAAISLALGLAFGLGGRETAARYTERWAGNAESAATKLQSSTPDPQIAARPNF